MSEAIEKLQDLRQSAKSLKLEVRGSQSERNAANLKGYKKWADIRDRAVERTGGSVSEATDRLEQFRSLERACKVACLERERIESAPEDKMLWISPSIAHDFSAEASPSRILPFSPLPRNR